MSRSHEGTREESSRGEWAVYTRTTGWAALGFRELWAYRELLWFLVWRDVLVRYKQAILGVAWAILQPILTMIVFTVVFNRFLGVESSSGDVPYEVFSFAGLLPWQFFAGSLSRSSSSVVANSNLLTKVYFPRLIMPLSGVLTGLVDFAISFLVLLVLMGAYGIPLTWRIMVVPLFIVLAIAIALGVSLWLSALNVLYRDVQYVIPFVVQLWMFVSPVIYSVSSVTSPVLRVVFALNPMTAVIGGFRWALVGERAFLNVYSVVSMVAVVLVLVTGLVYFKRTERVFADVV